MPSVGAVGGSPSYISQARLEVIELIEDAEQVKRHYLRGEAGNPGGSGQAKPKLWGSDEEDTVDQCEPRNKDLL